MQQTFEFYTVDPGTWKNKDLLNNVVSGNLTRDSEDETLGNASIECESNMDECYIRTYLVCVQDKIKEVVPLGTYLVQTPTNNFNGRTASSSLDAYTPLLELKDSKPPYGYAVPAGTNIMELVCDLARENSRAPVVPVKCDRILTEAVLSEFDDTWLEFLSTLASYAGYHFDLDELGRIIFAPDQKLAAMSPVWTYTDDNSSILYPEISLTRDLYGIPNVVEVLYSTEKGFKLGRAENRDVNSPISIQNRGREVVYRESNPEKMNNPTQEEIDLYARDKLESFSVDECTLSYKHGYCPVRVGDCVMLNYERAGIRNVKAKVVSQTIDCRPGCAVTETATFTTKLWG